MLKCLQTPKKYKSHNFEPVTNSYLESFIFKFFKFSIQGY